jgi:hypothetical protein
MRATWGHGAHRSFHFYFRPAGTIIQQLTNA